MEGNHLWPSFASFHTLPVSSRSPMFVLFSVVQIQHFPKNLFHNNYVHFSSFREGFTSSNYSISMRLLAGPFCGFSSSNALPFRGVSVSGDSKLLMKERERKREREREREKERERKRERKRERFSSFKLGKEN